MNSAASIGNLQRGAPPVTSGQVPTNRNVAANTQPKPRLIDVLASWVLEKSSWVAIGSRLGNQEQFQPRKQAEVTGRNDSAESIFSRFGLSVS
jgi:hypothetical protein